MTNNITESEIINAQKNWASSLEEIGRIYIAKGDYISRAKQMVNELYFFQEHDVLFKPTLASKDQFRNKFEDALSYFVASSGLHEEDKGFAIKPWHNIHFDNNATKIIGNVALAMGNYFLADFEENITKIEYSFAYMKDKNNNLRIILHHSSMPFQL
jgi:hypothetical protein